MITVNVYKDENEKINGVFISGHSNYDVNGKDIVCSAVSTAVQLTASIIEKVCPKYIFEASEKDVTMKLQIIESTEFCDIVIETLVGVLQSISESYAKYIKIKFIK
ncbi:MAG: ribosomal-processing cysteine protease Prp [Bacilli bacterium]|nr:ribosomal-processing cysteine protease Prp [Bacilli bacterium]